MTKIDLVERSTPAAPKGSVAHDYDLSELVETLSKRDRRSSEDAFDDVFDQVSTAWKSARVKEPFTVVVTATPSGHEELTRALAAWKETGLDEFAIRVTVYSIPSARLETVAGELSASDEPGHRTPDSALADDRTMASKPPT